MDLCVRYRSSIAVGFVALAAWGLVGAGCEPEFSDNQCQSDRDCFPDEVCAVTGVCQPQGYFPDVGPDATDSGDADMPAIGSIEVSPSSADISVGGSLQLEAKAYDEFNTPIDAALFEWSSSSPDTVEVDDRGVVSGSILGTATITARSVTQPDVEGIAQVTVVEGTVETVEVTPTSSTLFVGETRTFTATALNEGDHPIPEPLVVWRVEDDEIIEVDSDGVVTALSEGTSSLTANVEGVIGSADVEVLPVPVDRVEISPQDPTVAVGGTVQLEASPYDINDNELGDREVTWSSSDSSVAMVDTNGLVSAQAVGEATITAEAGVVSAEVTVTVVEGNAPPTANDHTVTTDEDTAVTIDLDGNDSDGDPLTFALESDPSNGSLGTLDTSTGEVTYTPDADFNGQDTFTFTVTDGEASSAPATVTIEVRPVNDPPIAQDDSVDTDEDTAVTVDVLANDSDVDGDDLSVSITSEPSNGSASVETSNKITYTPDDDYNGSDSLEYTVDDGNGGTDTATLTIQIAAVNDAPVANDDSATTDEDTAVTIDVLANDTDPDGDTLGINSTSTPSKGSASVSNDEITYTPDADENGSDSFDYTVSDGNLTATATVTVTINPVNDAPDAQDDTATASENTTITIDVLDNDTDVDGDTLSVSAIDTDDTDGTVSDNQDGTVDYTAPDTTGTDTFAYTVSDGNGGTDTATVTVTIQ